MDDALPVRLFQGRADLDGNSQGGLYIQAMVPLQACAQGLAVYEFHRNVPSLTGGIDVIDSANIPMGDSPCKPELVFEAFGKRLIVGQTRFENFQTYDFMCLTISCFIDDAHSSSTHLTEDLISFFHRVG